MREGSPPVAGTHVHSIILQEGYAPLVTTSYLYPIVTLLPLLPCRVSSKSSHRRRQHPSEVKSPGQKPLLAVSLSCFDELGTQQSRHVRSNKSRRSSEICRPSLSRRPVSSRLKAPLVCDVRRGESGAPRSRSDIPPIQPAYPRYAVMTGLPSSSIQTSALPIKNFSVSTGDAPPAFLAGPAALSFLAAGTLI